MLMRQWVDKLNLASEAYYNGKGELMSDYEWDALFDRLKLMEEETGITLPDSPTAKVSEDNVAGQKEEHEFPALSLAKTKSVAELVKWADKENSGNRYLARILLKGTDRMGMINDITKVTSEVMGVNIRRFNIGTEDGIFEGFIDLYVNDMDNLENLIKKLQRIKGLEKVSRKEL